MEIFNKILSEKNINIPNLLTATRLALSGIVAGIIVQDWPGFLPWALLAGAYLTDTFDWMSARMLHQETKLGKYLDPVVDFLSFHMILWAMWIHHEEVWLKLTYFWLSIANFLRDSEAFSTAYQQVKKWLEFDVSFLGKIKTWFNMWWIATLVWLGNSQAWESVWIWLLWIWVSLSVASLLEYKYKK